MRLHALAAVVVAVTAVDAAAQYCPSNPPPDDRDPRPKKRDEDSTCSRSKKGDPVAVTGYLAYSFDRLEDFFVLSPYGGLSVFRTYYSVDDPWDPDAKGGGDITFSSCELNGIPGPFGWSNTAYGASGHTSLRWTHNLFSFVDKRSSSGTLVRPPSGTVETFGVDCGTAGCWVPRYTLGSPGQPRRLRRTSAGFELLEEEGQKYVYEAPTADGGMYFLSSVVAASGDVVASVQYAVPDAGTCATLSTGGVPYVSAVEVNAGPRLEFDYVRLTREGASAECVLSGIRAKTGSTSQSLTTYSYLESGGAPRPGRLSQVVTPQYTESFDYTGGFRVSQNGNIVVQHDHQQADGGFSVFHSKDFLGELDFAVLQSGNCNGQWNASYCCSPGQAYQRTVTSLSAGRGDGSDAGASFTQAYRYAGGYGRARHTAQPLGRTDSCPDASVCSDGTVTWLWDSAMASFPGDTFSGNCSSTRPGYVSGIKNKRDNWVMTPNRFVSDAGIPLFEQLSEQRGIPSDTSMLPLLGTITDGVFSNALEWTKYEYQYPNATQRVSKETQPSAISGTRETEYRFDAQGRVIATVTTGKTRDLAGVESTKWRATFVSYDTNGRPTRREGPCFLAQTDASCTGGRPVVEYTYHPSGSGFSSGRLATMTRYPTPCVPGNCTGGLTTSFSSYTALGEPGSVTDENSVTTTYTYVGSQVASRTVGSNTWTYTWDTEKLTSVRNPQGDYEVFSYRDGTVWTGRLMWKAKAADEAGNDWSEKVEYEYWPDGTLKVERARCNTALSTSCPDTGTEGVRWERRYAADAERRQTWSTSTGFTSQQADIRGYDGANNVSRIGRAYNTPPAFCGAPGSPSDLCTLLTFDRAERLAQVDEKASATASAATTCLDYDKQGNVTRVIQGCTSGASCSTAGGVSSCADAPVSQYQHDDFGNVIEVRLPNTEDGTGTTYGVVRSEFDAQGNAIKRQDETQRANSNNVIQKFVFDALGRLTRAEQQWYSSTYTQYAIFYDNDASAPAIPSSCPQPSLTLGRVKLRTDPLWTTWYQYDAHGRVLKEVRVRTPSSGALPDCTSNPDDNPHTTYEYTANGNLSAIEYPHGRRVEFAYDTANGQNNRIISVSAAKWTGSAWTAPQVLLTNVRWEPYGGLRSYSMGLWKKGPSDWLTTEYLLGEAKTVPSTGCVTGAEAPDLSGRLRGVWVSTGEPALGEGDADVFNRTYSWVADQVARMDTCYLGNNSTPQVDDYRNLGGGLDGYDRLLRLKSADNPAMATAGGLYQQRKYTYDARGNILEIGITAAGQKHVLTYDTATRKRDRLLRMEAFNQQRLWNEWSYDKDGRVSQKRWPAYDDGTGGPYMNLGYLNDIFAPGGDSTIRSVTTSAGVTYTYYYDVENKRVQKAYPTGVVDEYFYDLSKNLLEDRGNVSTAGGQGYSLDEYVWLDGRPVAVFRSGFSSK
ncbi:MAG: hypothetical protein IT380_25410, partial [Myxococcales bacterium]|nr:hypothetical protein [Myxococcales bacterium]